MFRIAPSLLFVSCLCFLPAYAMAAELSGAYVEDIRVDSAGNIVFGIKVASDVFKPDGGVYSASTTVAHTLPSATILESLCIWGDGGSGMRNGLRFRLGASVTTDSQKTQILNALIQSKVALAPVNITYDIGETACVNPSPSTDLRYCQCPSGFGGLSTVSAVN